MEILTKILPPSLMQVSFVRTALLFFIMLSDAPYAVQSGSGKLKLGSY
jgi:hypothetical protein